MNRTVPSSASIAFRPHSFASNAISLLRNHNRGGGGANIKKGTLVLSWEKIFLVFSVTNGLSVSVEKWIVQNTMRKQKKGNSSGGGKTPQKALTHHSSQEHAIYGTSCLLIAFLSPTTCHLSNLRSINLILSLYPLSCSLSSFFLCWGFV